MKKILLAAAFILATALDMLQAQPSTDGRQFSPPKVCRTDDFLIEPLVSDGHSVAVTPMRSAEEREAADGHRGAQWVELRVFDVHGVVMFRKLLPTDFRRYSLPMEQLPIGVYVVELREGCNITTTKIIRRHSFPKT